MTSNERKSLSELLAFISRPRHSRRTKRDRILALCQLSSHAIQKRIDPPDQVVHFGFG